METIEVLVGRVGKPHGVRGDVTVDVRTDEPERRFEPGRVLRAKPRQGEPFALTVRDARTHQGIWLLSFDGVTDRNAAESIRGVTLHLDIAADERPEDPEEFYDHQLVGLGAVDLDGRPLGEVTRITHGAQDLLTIRTPDGRDALVPFVLALVPEVDLDAGRVVVADRPGLVQPAPDEPGGE